MHDEWFLPFGFAGCASSEQDLKEANYAVLPVPFESTTSYLSGTRNGPLALVEASRNMELFDEEFKVDITQRGIYTFPPLCADYSEPGAMIRRIEETVNTIALGDRFLIMLGGEHSITTGAVKAFHSRFPALSVLQIDAHLDLRDEFEGTPFNHASVMRRILDFCPRVSVGIRSFSEGEYRFLEEHNLPTLFMSDVRNNKNWIKEVCDSLSEVVYITIDLDGFDPAVIPGVGTPEPGGMTWWEVLALLKAVFREKKVVGADLVELMPLPGQAVSEFTAARLAGKLIAYDMHYLRLNKDG